MALIQPLKFIVVRRCKRLQNYLLCCLGGSMLGFGGQVGRRSKGRGRWEQLRETNDSPLLPHWHPPQTNAIYLLLLFLFLTLRKSISSCIRSMSRRLPDFGVMSGVFSEDVLDLVFVNWLCLLMHGKLSHFSHQKWLYLAQVHRSLA